MKTIHTIYSIITTIIIIFWVINKPEPITVVETQYITDTIIDSIPYTIPDMVYIDTTKPTQVIVYINNPNTDSIGLVLENDSLQLILDSLNTLTFHSDFLKLFPTSPKLLEIKLALDTLEIVTLNYTPQVEKKIYPIYLTKYKYHWIDGLLNKEELPEPVIIKSNKYKGDCYILGGYSVLHKYPLVSFQYEYNRNRYRLQLESSMTINNKPELYIIGKLGYKLNVGN